MSWMKRGSGGQEHLSAPAGYGVPPQPQPPLAQSFPGQQNMYPNYPGVPPNTASQTPTWQAPPTQQPQYNQYGQSYQQNYGDNANQFYQQVPQYNQNYANQSYNNGQQDYQTEYYQNEGNPMSNYPPNKTNSDSWEDNWGWEWDESSKQNQLMSSASQVGQVSQHTQQVVNANVIEDSFATTDTWNWSSGDKQEQPLLPAHTQGALPTKPLESNAHIERIDSDLQQQTSQRNVNTLPSPLPLQANDQDIQKEQSSIVNSSKRPNLESTLTPQWSIESQMSQESSDGPLTQSEGTYRSDDRSRNSSSPGQNADNTNFNYTLSGVIDDEPPMEPLVDSSALGPELGISPHDPNGPEGRDDCDELTDSMRDINIANCENPPPPPSTKDSPTLSYSPATSSLPLSPHSSMLNEASQTSTGSVVPLQAPSTSPDALIQLPSPVSTAPIQPPPGGAVAPPPPLHQTGPTAHALGGTNPFKQTGPLSHRAASKAFASSSNSMQAFPPSGSALASPAAVGRVALHNRTPVSFGANLETTPDNSERPDRPNSAPRSPSVRPAPENLEVAPRSDRNEYLQTAHLSSSECGEYPESVARRTGVGEEPPPGLARLVPGRPTQREDAYERPGGRADGRRTPDEFRRPIGLDRMVPGEPSVERFPQYTGGRVVPGGDRTRRADPPERPAERRELTGDGENLQDLGTAGAEQNAENATQASPRTTRSRASSAEGSGRERERRHYSRGERRSERERRERADRDDSPEARRTRRGTRSRRYDTEDTDYYSDRERDRRRWREGSHVSSRPPRADRDRDRDRDRERDRDRRRHEATERDRRYEDERARRGDRHRDRDRDRYEQRYRDIDPTRKHGNLRRERDEERRRGGEYVPRADSAEAATDEDGSARRGDRGDPGHPGQQSRRTRHSRRSDPYYDGYGGGVDPYLMQRQQYQYYEHLRLTNPPAYMQLYKQMMAGHAPYAGYGSLGYEARGEERGSVHSGRSSANLKGNDTDLTTDASLNLQLEESTVRSERMTPVKFSTAHIKGSISSRNVVVVRAAYPVDGLPATVHVVSLRAALADDARTQHLAAYPGPLLKGVTHKKSVVEYCRWRMAGGDARDPLGHALLWQLLELTVTHNGVVVGADIAELLMRNVKEYEYASPEADRRGASAASLRRDSTPSLEAREGVGSPPIVLEAAPAPAAGEDRRRPEEALGRLRELLLTGNRHEALEWAMASELWGHALQLSAFGDRRTRAGVAARFLASLPHSDPLHTLYASLATKHPPAATSVADERWGDWRCHVAMVLSNTSSKPDHDRRVLLQFGDSLASRGLPFSAQFCYVAAGEEFGPHPLAPLGKGPRPSAAPRLSLLLADGRAATLPQLATDEAICATEVYEYGLSLARDALVEELQPYKLVLATRLVDCGLYERALAYAEAAARAVSRAPRNYSPALLAAIAHLADRLKYHDPALHEDAAPEEPADGSEPSPRHQQQWLHDLQAAADVLATESASQQSTPLHGPAAPGDAAYASPHHYGGWQDQVPAPYPEPEEGDYSQYYGGEQTLTLPQPAAEPDAPLYGYDRAHAPSYADPYSPWQPDYSLPESAGAGAGGAGVPEAMEAEAEAEQEPRPRITMPGATSAASTASASAYHNDDERPASAADSERSAETPQAKRQEQAKSGWFGGIFTKLSLRPPNQMILPDDKNPSIVWDEDRKCWRNVDGDVDEARGPPPPPPRAPAPLPLPQPGPSLQAPLSNVYKMQRGRHIKKSYVDVFNPSGASTRALPPAEEVLGPAAPPPAAAPHYFVPALPSLPPDQQAEEERYRSGI